jgi:hypothetical protein
MDRRIHCFACQYTFVAPCFLPCHAPVYHASTPGVPLFASSLFLFLSMSSSKRNASHSQPTHKKRKTDATIMRQGDAGMSIPSQSHLLVPSQRRGGRISMKDVRHNLSVLSGSSSTPEPSGPAKASTLTAPAPGITNIEQNIDVLPLPIPELLSAENGQFFDNNAFDRSNPRVSALDPPCCLNDLFSYMFGL